MIYIPISIHRNTEIQNKELFKLITDKHKVKIKFDEISQEYTISNTYERIYQTDYVFKNKHYYYRSSINALQRYDFMEFNDIQNNMLLMNVIDDYFPILKKFIDYNELNTIKFKVINKINYSNYSNDASQLVCTNIIDYPIYTLPEILMIIALIRMMNFDNVDKELLIFHQNLNNLINVMNIHNIDIYTMFDLIKHNCHSNHIYDNSKFSLLGNNIIPGSPINSKQNIIEFDFLNIIFNLVKSGQHSQKIKDFFEKRS